MTRERLSALATPVDGVANVNFLDMRFKNVFGLVRLSAYVTTDVDGFEVVPIFGAVVALLVDFQILSTDER